MPQLHPRSYPGGDNDAAEDDEDEDEDGEIRMKPTTETQCPTLLYER